MGEQKLKYIGRKTGRDGFTIVELVVTIVIIGILAGIVIVAYGSWGRTIAQDQVRNDLTQAASAMESAKNFSEGYPSAVPPTFVASQDVTLTYVVGSDKYFCLEASSPKAGATYYFLSSVHDGPKEGSCTIYTNLARNPRPTSSTYYLSSSSAGTTNFGVGTWGERVRLTRVTTGALALYIERATGGFATALAGDQYTIRYLIYSPTSTTLTSQIGYGSPSSTSVFGTTNQTVNLVGGTMQEVRYVFTIPTGFNGQPIFPKILWASGVGAVGDYFEISQLMVVKGVYPAGAAFGDGDASSSWFWNGAPNDSTSSGPAL